jgi:uncharacterized protein
MHKLIDPKFKKVLNIYSKDKPDFLIPFFEAKTIQRLSWISQHCGTEYNNFFNYNSNISRLEHSLWVALIIWNFTKDKKQTLAWFFHDISHSVFSHVGDFILWDAENQESSEQHTTEIIKNDEIIIKELKKLWIEVNEVDDYEKYPIADNPGPQLAADRLEYTLGLAFELWNITVKEIKVIYKNIKILTNEKWLSELGFKNLEIAEKFWFLSLDNDEWCISSYESIVSMAYLSEILKKVLEKKLVIEKDLYTLTDHEIIKIIEKSKIKKIVNMWKYYKNISSYRIDRIKPNTSDYFVSSNCKRRYIDPLIETKNWNLRLSSFSKNFIKRKDYHLNRKEEWIRLDYKI